MITSGAAVVARFLVAESFGGGSFKDDEEERSEGGNAGCNDEDERFVARYSQ